MLPFLKLAIKETSPSLMRGAFCFLSDGEFEIGNFEAISDVLEYPK